MCTFLEEQGDDIDYEFPEDLVFGARPHTTIPSPPPEFDSFDLDSDEFS
jgi:hypothetical protein